MGSELCGKGAEGRGVEGKGRGGEGRGGKHIKGVIDELINPDVVARILAGVLSKVLQ